MEMPQPTEHHQRLHGFAGTWRGRETMHPSHWEPGGAEAEGVSVGRVALNGFVVVLDYEQLRGGERVFEGHGVYWWDPEARAVVLTWWDCMGMAPDVFRGRWEGDALTLRAHNSMGHWRSTYALPSEGSLTSRMEVSQDGETWTTLFDGRYRREG